jgi:hypothetical protein
MVWLLKYAGKKAQPSIISINPADHSNPETASPLSAPAPARPTKCSDPMFEEKSEAATAHVPISLPAKKKSATSSSASLATTLAVPVMRTFMH